MMSPAGHKRLCGHRDTPSGHGSHDLPEREFAPAAAAGGASLIGLSLVLRCLLGRLVSFQAGGVPLRHFLPPYRNVDNRYVNAQPGITISRKHKGYAEDQVQASMFKYKKSSKIDAQIHGWKTFIHLHQPFSLSTTLCIVILFNNGPQYKRQIVVKESWLTGTITSLSALTEPQINKAHLQSQCFHLK